ncbi:MAG: VWA domain-containing protein [Deltaproteobacteria bacterium]|nr:VWA domain-containing protein [Deltaproteobacteria bacterium]
MGLNPFSLLKLELDIKVDGQMATVNLRKVFKNNRGYDMELDFISPLPAGAALLGVTLTSGGKELPGRIHPKEEAYGVYEEIVRTLKDPALIEYAGYGLFRARIFPAPANGTVSLDLNMSYLVSADFGRADLDFPLIGAAGSTEAVPEQDFAVVLKNVPDLGAVFSPFPEAEVEREPNGARATLRLRNKDILKRFQLYYQTGVSGPGGYAVSSKTDDGDGFFLFLAEAEREAEPKKNPKDVVFVLDRSGSMEGNKIEQAKNAALFVLSRLSPADGFNIVTFAYDVEIFRPTLSPADPENLREARRFVSNIRAGGGTFLSGGVEAALKSLDSPRPAYILLLTDGQPNYGLTGEKELVELVEPRSPGDSVRVFSFGVGDDVNARLLDRFSTLAGGVTTHVSEDEDIEEKVSAFFKKIGTPVLSAPVFRSSIPVNRAIPRRLPDLFRGGRLLVVGRYPEGGEAVFSLTGKDGEKERTLEWRVRLEDSPSSAGPFVSRLWAAKRIGEIVNELDLGAGAAENPGGREELARELTNISRAYGILTPYTSFLAAEDGDLDFRVSSRRTGRRLSALKTASGAMGTMQRRYKAALSADVCHSLDPSALFPSGEAAEETRRFIRSFEDPEPGKPGKPGKLRHPARRLRPFHDDWAGPEKEARKAVPRGVSPGGRRTIQAFRDEPANPEEKVLRLGDKSFFIRKGSLIEGGLTADEIEKAREVRRLSLEFQALAERLAPHNLVWLGRKEPVVFRFEGKIYRVAD